MSPAKKQTTALRATLATLAALPIERLKAQFEHAFGKPAGKTTRDHLVRALAERGTAPAQATTSAPTKPSVAAKAPRKPATPTRDPRLPAPGTVLERTLKGKVHKVTVKEDGFEYLGKPYRSLTAVAKQATGYPSISGTLFFGIAKPAAKPPTAKAPRKGARKQG